MVATIRLARSLRGRARRGAGSSADHRGLGSVGDAYDNALAVVEYIGWYDAARLHERVG
jgi:hypothetical protein